MKFLAMLLLSMLVGCETLESFQIGSNDRKDQRIATTEFTDVTVNETCVSETHETIGPQGLRGSVAKLFGFGSFNEPRGTIKCQSEPFSRTMTKRYGYGQPSQ